MHREPPAPARSSAQQAWWRDAVVYQIYVRSFADSDGDGIGDLEGVRRHLDDLVDLGADAIWLNPCYPSPQRDHGYDVSDYFSIEPTYGDLDTFDALVSDASARGLQVLMDVVPNHCSEQHPWFEEALASPPGSPARDRFFFRDGRGADGELPPNNWRAVFGGSAWTRVPDAAPDDHQWYLGTFTPYQPDLDHTNPEVADYFERVLRFWFDRGVDGFRVDAVPPIGKAPGLPDAPPVPEGTPETAAAFMNPYTAFVPEGHDVWRRWRRVLDDYVAADAERSLMMVAEAYTPRRPDLLAEYLRPDEFHQAFAFDLMLAPWHAPSMRRAILDSLELLRATGAAPTWTLNNHDIQRIVTRLGRAGVETPEFWGGPAQHVPDAPIDEDLGRRRSRAAAVLMLALPGSVYLYQGEELGLPEVLDLPDDVRQDPVFHRTKGHEVGRDGCRIPLPWTDDPATSYGFSPPGSASPWLPHPHGWGGWAASLQRDDPSSMRSLYRRALEIRRTVAVPAGPVAETVTWDDATDDRVVAVQRGDLLAVCNTTTQPVTIPVTGEIVLTSCTDTEAGRTGVSGATGAASPRGDAGGTVVPADTTLWIMVQ